MCKKGGPRCPSPARARLLKASQSMRLADQRAAAAATPGSQRAAAESQATAASRLDSAVREYALTEPGIASARAAGLTATAERLQTERDRLRNRNGSDHPTTDTVQEQAKGTHDEPLQDTAVSQRELAALRERYTSDAAVTAAGSLYAGRVWTGTDTSGDRVRDRHELAVDGRTVAIKQAFTADPGAASLWSIASIPAPRMYELDSAAEASTFRKAISGAATGKFGSSVYVYGTSDYAGMRTFLAEGGKAGFALKGDELVSVFNNDPALPRAGSPMIELAIQQGARRGDAFDVALPHFYSRSGFDVVARLPWDDAHMPPGWDKHAYRGFNNGEPDVVFFAYRPRGPHRYQPGQGRTVTSYDAGVDSAAAAAREWNPR